MPWYNGTLQSDVQLNLPGVNRPSVPEPLAKQMLVADIMDGGIRGFDDVERRRKLVELLDKYVEAYRARV